MTQKVSLAAKAGRLQPILLYFKLLHTILTSLARLLLIEIADRDWFGTKGPQQKLAPMKPCWSKAANTHLSRDNPRLLCFRARVLQHSPGQSPLQNFVPRACARCPTAQDNITWHLSTVVPFHIKYPLFVFPAENNTNNLSLIKVTSTNPHFFRGLPPI